MKIFIILTFFAFTVQASIEEWKHFKSVYNKTYIHTEEEKIRENVFQKNLIKIHNHNKLFVDGKVTYKMSVNKFADMTEEEFKNYLKLSGPRPKIPSRTVYKVESIKTTSVDWRDSGAVTPVKDQGSCGSCWAFSTTGSLEGQNKIKNEKLVSLSEQELVDCSRSYGNAGCGGGWMDYGFKYVIDNGINTEVDYPYKGVDSKCTATTNIAVKAVGYVDIPADDENALISAIETVGPISVAIDATTNFQFYSSGIFIDKTCSKFSLNHGVLAVGFDEQSIIIKNSWGSNWGESGYIRFQRGSNLCGIASVASYPEL